MKANHSRGAQRNIGRRDISVVALMIGAGGLYCGSALAQIDELVVTAQKREQNLQDVPVAISAIPSDKLEAAGVTSTTDLNIGAKLLSWRVTFKPGTAILR
ncbi:MAG: hypothetical protein AAGL49_08550, partial [Pseudomonadota bacterium]